MNTVLLIAALLGQADGSSGMKRAQAPSTDAAPQPLQPEVSDPMLVPVPAAPLVVGSWDEALGYLRQRSTDLGLAQAQVEAAVGQRRVSLAALLPTLNGSVAVQYNLLGATTLGTTTPVGTGTGYTTTSPLGTGTLAATLSLIDLRSFQSLRSANASRQAAERSLEETRRQLTRTLAQLLAQVASSERLSDVNRVNLRSALERLALAQRRLELGAGTKLDVIRLQQDAQTARASVVSGDESLRQARDALGLVLGLDRPVGVPRDISLEQLFEQGQRECHKLSSVAERADQAAARARLEAAGHAVSAARASYLPTLEAQSTAVAVTVDPGFARVPVWNIGVVLSLPFYDGGARAGYVLQARAQEETARQNAVVLERSADVEVRRTQRGVEVARTQQDIATQARGLAEENDRLTRRSFEVGSGTSQDLVVSATALRQAELNLVVSEFQSFQARIEAFLAEAACDW